MKVFVSHSTKDRWVARQIAQELERRGITTLLVDDQQDDVQRQTIAYAEARKMSGKPTAANMFILSLGTGETKQPYAYRKAKDWGQLEWVKPVLDIMMSGVSETVDYQLKRIYDAVGRPDQYLRITPDLGDASPDLDDAGFKNLRNLRDAGQEAAQVHFDKLQAFAARLI